MYSQSAVNMHLVMNEGDDTDGVDEGALIAEIDKKFKASESLLQSFHRQWFVNIAMRRGMQYVQTDVNAKAVIMPPESEDRVRMIVNKIMGIHQTRLAKLVKDLPGLDVVPGSKQEHDKELARKGTKMLAYLWQEQKMVEKMVELASWMIDCGSAFLQVYWDNNAGPKIPHYQRHEGEYTGMEGYSIDENGYVLGEDGEPIVKEISLGSVRINVVPSFDVINDGVSTDIDDSLWIMTAQAKSLDEICERWPEKGPQVKMEKDIQSRAYYQRRLISLVGNQSEFFTPETEYQEEMATVKTYQEKPGYKYPGGRYIVVAGGIVLEAGPLPYLHGKYDLIKFDDISVSGSFWGIGTTENLVPIQKGFNRTWSQIIENANNLGNIKMLLGKDHGLAKEAYDDSGTEVLEVNQGAFIQQLQPAELPSYVVNQISMYDKAFEDVSGQHEVSNGRAPDGVKSGRAIMALQEQDDTRLAPTKLKFLRNIEAVGVMCLQLFEQFQDEDRTYQIIGESVYDIDEFSISKDEIASMNKDVRTQSENIISSNKALQQDAIMDMWDKGVFGDKEDPKIRKRILQMLEFGNLSEFFEEENQDIAMAMAENKQFIEQRDLQTITDPVSGMQVKTLTAYEFEDHDKHLRVLNQLRKTPLYRQLSPQIRRGIDIHAEQHTMFFNRQNPAPLGSQPAPGGKPTGTGPAPAQPGQQPAPPPPPGVAPDAGQPQ